MKKITAFLIFLTFFTILILGLFTDTRDVSSPLIGKTIPDFKLTELKTGQEIDNKFFPENTFLINVWASWCQECTREHALLKNIQQEGIEIIGINYKDNKQDALGWLGIYGNPYLFNIYDYDGEYGIEMGVYGVPETFIISDKGVIIDKFIGALDEQTVYEKILPKFREITKSNF